MILTLASSIATILQDVVAVAVLASLIVILQMIRCDSYYVYITPEDWKRVGDRSWEYTHKLAHGFKFAPCSVWRKTNDNYFKEVGMEIRYSDDDKEIKLCMNGDEGLEGRLVIGGPRGF